MEPTGADNIVYVPEQAEAADRDAQYAAVALPPPGTIPYDPAAERDPLISGHITRGAMSGRPVFRGPIPYPVGAVVQQLHATGDDRTAVLRSFPELTEAALEAARRFWRLHGDEIRDHFV